MALVSRRWKPSDPGQPGQKAGADCSSCGVAAEAEGTGVWRCPKCGTEARACGDGCGLKACELLKGHRGAHESASGSAWPEKPRPRLSGTDRGMLSGAADLLELERQRQFRWETDAETADEAERFGAEADELAAAVQTIRRYLERDARGEG